MTVKELKDVLNNTHDDSVNVVIQCKDKFVHIVNWERISLNSDLVHSYEKDSACTVVLIPKI
jgi:hypothetical protein